MCIVSSKQVLVNTMSSSIEELEFCDHVQNSISSRNGSNSKRERFIEAVSSYNVLIVTYNFCHEVSKLPSYIFDASFTYGKTSKIGCVFQDPLTTRLESIAIKRRQNDLNSISRLQKVHNI